MNLGEKIENLLLCEETEDIAYPYRCLPPINKAMAKIKTERIVNLPELKEAIEKADKFDKATEGLRAEKKCNEKGCEKRTNMFGKLLYAGSCETCNDTGKILRPLTNEEKEEIMKLIPTAIFATMIALENIGESYFLSSGVRVVRGK